MYVGSFFAAHAQGLADMADDSAKATAEDIEKSKKPFDFAFHGFLRTNFVFGKDDMVLNDDFYCKKIGTILQLQLEGYASNIAHFYAATNFEFDLVDFTLLEEEVHNVEDYLGTVTDFKVVEAYIDIYPATWMSIRGGKQIITWGEIEGIEAPTDILTPMDYTTKSSVFEDSRMSIVALAFNFFFARQKLELVWCPIFQPSKMEAKDILQKAKDLGTDIVDLSYYIIPDIEKPDYNLKNGEYAGRLSGDISFFRYGLAFLYGFNDLPDSEVSYELSSVAPYGARTNTTDVTLIYTRVMTPALDMAFNVKDMFSIKASAVMHITEDFEGERDDMRNSDVVYLAGMESTNIGADIYFALYFGQMWVINYTPAHLMVTTDDPAHDYNLVKNEQMLRGFDQFYKYKWIISGIIQRSFLTNKNLELSLRYAFSASPRFDEIDYTVNFNIMYKIIDNLSITCGLVAADKIGVIKNMVILELQYSF